VQLVVFSKKHHFADLSNPLLSPLLNKIIYPLRYIETHFYNKSIIEPSYTSLPFFSVTENEAIYFFSIFSVLLCIQAIYFIKLSINNYESNIWYVNGGYWSFLGLVILAIS